jgi:hypothetical protein
MKQSTRRLLAYGSNATLVTVMVLIALVGIYLLAANKRVRVDMSEEGRNTLAVETLEKIQLLDMDGLPVKITAFSFQRGKEDSAFKDRAVKDLLKEVGVQSAVIDWAHVDFDKEKLSADQLGVREYGHIVIELADKRVDIKARELFRRVGRGPDQHLEFVGEDALSRGLSQLMSDTRRVAYVLQGSGEMSPDDLEGGGLSDLSAALSDERYDMKKLSLAATGSDGSLPVIPEDAALVVLARPTTTLSEYTDELLLSWLGQGGSLLVLVDVDGEVPRVLQHLGIERRTGTAMQNEYLVGFPSWPFPQTLSHAITQEIGENALPPLMASPAPLAIREKASAQGGVSTLLKTRRGGWIERGGDPEQNDLDVDEKGEVSLGIALELQAGKGIVRAGKPSARVVVYSDADIFSNQLINQFGNLTLARDTVHWLAGEDRRLGITGAVGQSQQARRLALTQQELGTVRWLSMVLMPLLVTVIGVLVWFGRRGR